MWRSGRLSLTLVLLLGAMCASPGCSSWHLREEPRTFLETTKKSHYGARITLSDGRRIEMFDPAVQGDSLVGFNRPRPSGWSPEQRERVAVPLDDVKSLETQGTKPIQTVVLVGLAVGVVLVLYVGASLNSTFGP